MKRTTTIVLFASIFAVTVGTLGLSSNSATSLMVSAAPQSQEISMLGHVEYLVTDEMGNVKQYLQGDNEVVNGGEDCVANLVFGVGGCTASTVFSWVGIGNHTSGTVSATNQTLADATDNAVATCADTTNDGDMARRNGVVALTSAASGPTGTIVTIDTSTVPFTFDASNATTVYDSGLFNANYAGSPVNGKCPTATSQTSGTDWEMFSRQLLNTNQGITVSDGDSLSVKWTITVG
ncbi:hypothetical protein [Nitrosopumilus sp. S4]